MLGIRVKICRHKIRKPKLAMKMNWHRLICIIGSVGLGLFWGLAMKAEIFSSPQNVSNSAEGSSSASIAVDNLNIFLAWQDNREILFSKSVDEGITWSTPQNISNTPGFSANPAIATNGSGIFITWEENEVVFSKSIDGGTTWSTPQNISNTGPNTPGPAITTDGTNIFIAWWDGNILASDVFFSRSTDGGTTWSTPQNISTNIGQSADPVITTDGTNIFIAWWDTSLGSVAEILFSKSTDGGDTWSVPQNVSNNAMTSRSPSIATNGTDIFLSWNEFSSINPNEVVFSKSIDGGTTWSVPQNISNNEGNSEDSSIATDSTSLFITWKDDFSGNDEIFFSRSDDGTTWTPGKNISGNTGRDVNPTSTADGTNIFFAWENGSIFNEEIFFARTDVVDTIAPVITLKGDLNIILGVGVGTYIEAGALVTDNDTDYSETITIGGDAVDTTTLGTYTVTYDAPADAAGNTVPEVTRTVQVVDVSSGIIFDQASCEMATGVWAEPNRCSLSDGASIGETLTIANDITLIGSDPFNNSGILVNFGTINIFNTSDITNSGTIENSGTINFNSFGLLGLFGEFAFFSIENSGIINNPGTINNICGEFSGNAPASGNPIMNDCGITISDRNSCELAQGVWTAPDTCSTSLILTIGETLTIENGINFNAGSVTGFGSININPGGTFNNSGESDIGSPGSINNSGVFNNIGGISGDGFGITNAGDFNNSGTITNIDASIRNSGTFVNLNTISLCCLGSLLNTGIFQNPGTFSNPIDGAITNSGTFNNSGTLETFFGMNFGGGYGLDNTNGIFNNACNGIIIGDVPTIGNAIIQEPCDDPTIPVITLIGDAIVTLQAGIDTYTEAGATVTDDIDDPFPATVGGDSVDVNTVGTYIVTYDATDSTGKPAVQVIRTVNVVPTPGDLDGDFDVDLDDLDIILDARNTPADGGEDPQDLDGDGVITVLDARIGVLSCTRPRCSNQ